MICGLQRVKYWCEPELINSEDLGNFSNILFVNLVTVPLLDQPLQLSGTRERKKVQRFTEEFKSEPKDAIVIEIPEGKGTALGDIPRIDAVLQVSIREGLVK